MGRIGERLGSWILEEEIGSGGNGRVYRARGGNGDEVALKVVRVRLGDERYRRFLDEVAFLHSHRGVLGVMPVVDLYAPQRAEGSKYAWIAMPVAVPIKDALEGSSLADVVRAIVAIAETLARLADEGVSHRDIKPDNLFRLAGQWVVGDFGLVSYPGKEAVTAAGRKLGPLFYVAPEMLADPSKATGMAADVYSLAKTLWVLATGQTYPVPGQLRVGEPSHGLAVLTSEARAGLLDAVLEAATRDDPRARLTMREFHAELTSWLEGSAAPIAQLSIDEIAQRIASLVAPEVSVQEREREREARVVGALDALLSLVQPVLEDLAAALPVQVGVVQSPRMFDVYRLHSSQTGSRHGVEIVRQAAEGGRYSLRIMNGVQEVPDGKVYFVAGYALEDALGPDRLLWGACARGIPGSAGADRSAHAVASALHYELGEVLGAYVERLNAQET